MRFGGGRVTCLDEEATGAGAGVAGAGTVELANDDLAENSTPRKLSSPVGRGADLALERNNPQRYDLDSFAIYSA